MDSAGWNVTRTPPTISNSPRTIPHPARGFDFATRPQTARAKILRSIFSSSDVTAAMRTSPIPARISIRIARGPTNTGQRPRTRSAPTGVRASKASTVAAEIRHAGDQQGRDRESDTEPKQVTMFPAREKQPARAQHEPAHENRNRARPHPLPDAKKRGQSCRRPSTVP